MVSFRKWMLAPTALVLFTGLASAQTSPTCVTNVASTPILRAEGFTEETGDVVFSCTGGTTLTTGASIPQVNVTVFLNTAVTSRLLPISGVTSSSSEALLMIDEPGVGVLPAGPLPGKVCTTPLTGCAQTVGTGYVPVEGTAQGSNIFQGIVSGNQVTFFGVPVLPPGTTASRVLRITNLRVNAASLGGGSASGVAQVIASISVSGSSALPISNPNQVVGFVQAGLSASASSNVNATSQCTTQTRTAVSILTYTEGFANAFKTRVVATTNTAYNGQSGSAIQNVPGTIYFSESNFIQTVPTGAIAGLADYGTRLKATYNNIPSGVRLYVSTNNVNNASVNVTPPAVIGGSAANTVAPFAQLVTSETVSDGTATGFFPSVTSTDTVGNVPVVEIPVVNGSATAIWEVVNTNPNTIESVKFATYVTYVANVASSSPTPGTATVNLSFAPTPTTAFSASAGGAASSTLTVPRFVADTVAARNIFTINICRTILLYPYVTNILGFDTGLAIANTSTDPFGTGAQAGTCTLNWYQGTTNPAATTTGSIASGTVYTALASVAVPGFNGYMIAVCNFQYAHGFAFVSDLGARNLAMGYLPLVITDPTTQTNGVRNASPVGASNVAINGGGEGNAH
jgi:hypothetical protein